MTIPHGSLPILASNEKSRFPLDCCDTGRSPKEDIMQNIKDKVVVITGASSGLGEATARALAKNGAKLVLGARRIDRLKALASKPSLGDKGGGQTDRLDR